MSTISWTLLGVIVNCLFFGHGILLLSSSNLVNGIGLVGASAIVYSLLGFALLGAAWVRPAQAIAVIAALLNIAYAVFLAGVTLQADITPGFEWLAGMVLLIAFLAANLLAVRRVLSR